MKTAVSLMDALPVFHDVHNLAAVIGKTEADRSRREVTGTAIEVNNLSVSIGDNRILKNISIKIPNHKITCIIGPSGCGKSTLLKTINRLIDDDEKVRVKGEIIIDGENIYGKRVEVTHIRKKMGLLSQRPTPLPMSIFDNITFGCKIHGVRNKKLLKRIVEDNLRDAVFGFQFDKQVFNMPAG